MPFIDSKAPKKPRKLADIWTADGPVLFWTKPKAKKWSDEATKFVVYRFEKGEKINLNDPSKIVKITHETMYRLPYEGGLKKYTYVVTSLDRLSNESKGAKLKIKL